MAVEKPRRGRLFVALPVLAAALPLVAWAGWAISDRLEQRNEFCNSCHLPNGTPLHRDLRRDFDGVPHETLASVHGGAKVEARGDGPEAAFRCYDCHSGTGLVGRLRVKALAAKDALWYVAGRFEEPGEMRHPLRDADCRKCHATYPESERRAEGTGGWTRPFHAVAVHNAGLEVGCVECHLAHERGGIPDAYFLQAKLLVDQCARCHAELAGER
ncbi:MAG TPA: hypothetical protein VMW35_13270 [Myxococcota bacterium]|jgi:hypothetical protein|nr:hypothetical protein [Myxococcota bacterium]